MTKIGSHTTSSYIGFWLFEGSASTGWISNNSPNDAELSGNTEGLNYLRLNRVTQQDLRNIHGFDSWHVGNGKKGEFTYGDDDGFHTFFAKLTGSTLHAMHDQKKKAKRFEKVHNRGTADRVYFFNRFASSSDGYEYFYSDDLSPKKYAPVIVRGVNFGWLERTNRVTIARFQLEEVWPEA